MIDITECGAKPNNKDLSTDAIQKAIDKVHESGGGRVVIPAGTFTAGTFHLKSRVDLHLLPGAILQASSNLKDYPKSTPAGHNKDRQPYHWIIAKKAEDASITGHGVLDGNGPRFWHEKPAENGWYREKDERPSPMLEAIECRNFRLIDVTIRNSPGWTVHLHDCDHVFIRGITITNDLFGPNTDGIDVHGCHDVIISDCSVTCGDDAIVLKTTEKSRTCERVMVTNCRIETNCVALKLGAMESYKDMREVTFSNCVVTRSNRIFGLYSLEGGTLENIMVNNITGDTLGKIRFNRPIHIDLRKRTKDSKMGAIRNVLISNFIASTDGRILLTAQEGAQLENIILRGIHLNYPKIEDPFPDAQKSKSTQFSNESKDARVARGAIIAENVRMLTLTDFTIRWPKLKNWPFPNEDEPDFPVIWGRNLVEGLVRAPLAKPNKSNLMPYSMLNSTIRCVQG